MKDDENLIDVNTRLLGDQENGIDDNHQEVKTKRKKAKLDLTVNNNPNSNLEMILYVVIVTILFIVLVFIFYYLHYGEYKVEVLIEDKDMVKPVIDMRKYKVIKLQNGLDVLLISDNNTTKCTASMSVGVGSFKDDNAIQGLAHFTEHMIFLGSKSYPKPSIFENLLTNHLGMTNAFTEEEKTTFYFEIEWHGFTKALEMFSRMFAEPIFDMNFMNKEIDAVNSENEKNLNKDPWRENQVIKSLADQTHPFGKFTTGNNKTLKSVDILTLHEKVVELYEKYYMPDNMKLVVLSNQNLEQLQDTVAYYFSDIKADQMEDKMRKAIEDNKPQSSNYDDLSARYETHETTQNNNTTNTTVTFVPFTKNQLGQIVWYQKIVGGQHLDIIFNLDEILTKYQTKPLDYVSYLLRYSGQGSLIGYLKKNKLASKIEVGVVASYRHFSQYALSIYLTNEGLDHIEEVIHLTFNYINLIKSQPIKASIYEELHNITSVQFRFLEKSERYGDYLALLAGMMVYYKESDYNNLLYVDYVHSTFNETLIKNYLNSLTPNNALIIIGSTSYPKSLDFSLGNANITTEKWYGTLYKHNKLSPSYIEVLSTSNVSGETFKLRDNNEFITRENAVVSCFGVGIITSYKNTTLHELCDMEKADLTPDLAINSKNLLAWYKLDRTFLTPKVDINLLFVSPALRSSAKDYLALNIYFNFIKSAIESKLAEAKDSGNEITLEFNENGIVLFISCFTDLADKIVDRTTQIIFNSEIDENIFNQMVEVTKNSFEGNKNDQPFEKALSYFTKLVKNNIFSYQEMLLTFNQINYKDFIKQYKNIQKSFYITSQFYGNINEKQLLNIESYLQPYLNQDANIVAQKMQTDDEKVIDFLHNHNLFTGSYVLKVVNDLPSEISNVCVNFFQIGKRDIRSSLIMNLVELSWENLFFYNLRTIKQYGYIVAASKFVKDNFMYYLFIVQGSKTTPDEVNVEIDTVLNWARNRLVEMEEDQLNEYKETLLAELNKKENNLKERSGLVWKEIYENSLDFNRKYKLIDDLKYITRDDLIESFDSTFYRNVNKLSIQIYSQYNVEDAVLLNKYTEEAYNLNPDITSFVTDDLKLLRNKLLNKEKR